MQALSWTMEGFSAAKLKKAEIEWSSRDTLDVAKKVCMVPNWCTSDRGMISECVRE